MRDEEHDHPDLTPSLLLRGYALGIFPMAESADADALFWVDPQLRGVLPLEDFHVPRRLARSFRKTDFEVRINSGFSAVLDGCANRPETWINPQIRRLYLGLHRMGHAHSVEIWRADRLVGGVYGVTIGAAFFGESMFSRERDASKLALIALVARLRAGGYRLLDTQFVTDHLARFGAVEIPRARYQAQLSEAIPRPADFFRLPRDAGHQLMLQLSTQTS